MKVVASSVLCTLIFVGCALTTTELKTSNSDETIEIDSDLRDVVAYEKSKFVKEVEKGLKSISTYDTEVKINLGNEEENDDGASNSLYAPMINMMRRGE